MSLTSKNTEPAKRGWTTFTEVLFLSDAVRSTSTLIDWWPTCSWSRRLYNVRALSAIDVSWKICFIEMFWIKFNLCKIPPRHIRMIPRCSFEKSASWWLVLSLQVLPFPGESVLRRRLLQHLRKKSHHIQPLSSEVFHLGNKKKNNVIIYK